MERIKILGTICSLEFGRYHNGTVAIEAMHNGQPFLTATVNWEANWEGFAPYKKQFKFPVVVIKDYSENEGVANDLIAAGVVTGGPYMAGTNGTVQVMRLTPEWQKIALNQLKKIPLVKS